MSANNSNMSKPLPAAADVDHIIRAVVDSTGWTRSKALRFLVLAGADMLGRSAKAGQLRREFREARDNRVRKSPVAKPKLGTKV